jgi:hypothetical protein
MCANCARRLNARWELAEGPAIDVQDMAFATGAIAPAHSSPQS